MLLRFKKTWYWIYLWVRAVCGLIDELSSLFINKRWIVNWFIFYARAQHTTLLRPGIWALSIYHWFMAVSKMNLFIDVTFNIWGSGRALRLNAERLNVCVIFDFSSQHLSYVFNAFSSFHRFHDKLQYIDCVYKCIYIFGPISNLRYVCDDARVLFFLRLYFCLFVFMWVWI